MQYTEQSRHLVTDNMQLSAAFLFLSTALAAPTPSSIISPLKSSLTSLFEKYTAPKTTKMCGQYQSQANGPFTLYTNGWDWPAGNGTQCSEINAVSGNAIAWDTTWSWTGIAYQVKSYTNVQNSFTKKKLSAYTNIPTKWTWDYTGTNLSCNGTCRVRLILEDANRLTVQQWLMTPSVSL